MKGNSGLGNTVANKRGESLTSVQLHARDSIFFSTLNSFICNEGPA